MTVTDVVPGLSEAVTYLQLKVAEFRDLGTRRLPQQWAALNVLRQAAEDAGDMRLAEQAQTEMDTTHSLQDDWEVNSERLQTIEAALGAIGITFGAVPLIPVATAIVIVAIAGAITALFLSWNSSARRACIMAEAAVSRNIISGADGARLCMKAAAPNNGVSWPTALTLLAVLGAAVYFLPRKRGA